MARPKSEIKQILVMAAKRARNRAKTLDAMLKQHRDMFHKVDQLVRTWRSNPLLGICVHGQDYTEQIVGISVHREDPASEEGWAAQCRFFSELRELVGKRKEDPIRCPCTYPATGIGQRQGIDIYHKFVDLPLQLVLHNTPGPEEGDRCQIVKEMVEVSRLECKLTPSPAESSTS